MPLTQPQPLTQVALDRLQMSLVERPNQATSDHTNLAIEQISDVASTIVLTEQQILEELSHLRPSTRRITTHLKPEPTQPRNRKRVTPIDRSTRKKTKVKDLVVSTTTSSRPQRKKSSSIKNKRQAS